MVVEVILGVMRFMEKFRGVKGVSTLHGAVESAAL